MNNAIQALSANLTKLSDRDQKFASSLITVWQKGWKLSPKQQMWVDKLLDRALNPPVKREVSVGDMTGIIGLFDKAKEHLKYPAVVLAVTNTNGYDLVRLVPAGEKARVPGSINIVSQETNEEGKGHWFGRIHQDGRYEIAGQVAQEVVERLTSQLRAFAADPVTGAKKSAKLTGCCCFCNTTLSDQRSTDVGYGPICARHFGLPWGGVH